MIFRGSIMKYTIRAMWYMVKAYFASKWMLFKSRKMAQDERRMYVYQFLRRWCPGLFKACGTRVIYHGLENMPDQGGVLYVGNHQSIFDIIAMLSIMEFPTAFVNKKELDHVFFLGALMRGIDCVSIDREDLRQSLSAIKTASERLKEGMNMVIFPEGTRSKNGQMGEFKKGSIRAATNIGGKIVPFRITSEIRDILENNKGLHIIPQEVHVYIGKPIDTGAMTRQEQKDLAEEIPQIVAALS